MLNLTSENQSLLEYIVQSQQKMDSNTILESLVKNLEFVICEIPERATKTDLFEALARTVRDKLIWQLNETQQRYEKSEVKQVNYLSLEYLIGRSLRNNLVNLEIYDVCQQVMERLGVNLIEIEECERDAGLGNGGLGRLAACFLDSMATLQLPAFGYGIRYEYGIFQQKFENGQQIEFPDGWLENGYPWEIRRPHINYPVRFYGRVIDETDERGRSKRRWVETEQARAVAFDVPVSGYANETVNVLRLWSARAVRDFDLASFNRGDYLQAVMDKQRVETISKVLYPNDQAFSGKELRLKQQYFFVSASLQDMIVRFKDRNQPWVAFPDFMAIQLNDTHPSIAIPELMRLLIDEEGLEWDEAWQICRQTFAYTNHTVLPEALERWSVELLNNLLPRHMELIYQINDRFLQQVRHKSPRDPGLLSRVSMIEEGWEKQVRMPFLSIVGSHTTNGVAALHTELLKETIFRDFYNLFPERFQNKTNGITPRLWLRCANPELAELISDHIGSDWITELDKLEELIDLAAKESFQHQWQEVKKLKKQQLCNWITTTHKVELVVDSLFDVQVKRIHEYKRQLLNILHVVHLYDQLRKNPKMKVPKRTFLFGGKAAPGYYMAKQIIRLINDVAEKVNKDVEIEDRLRVLFVTNYGVSSSEKIIAASEVSEHISTAGTEASGTSNMKFSLNGCILLGTHDGATIEIGEEVGSENIFTFGLKANDVQQLKANDYDPQQIYNGNPRVRNVLDLVGSGFFNPQEPQRYRDIIDSLIYNDHYLLLADFDAYTACQELVGKTYQDVPAWTQMSIANTAKVGKFSSDRTISEYATQIWNVHPLLHGR